MYGIGIYNVKHSMNLGTLFRSAVNFRANFIFTIGRRYTGMPSDTIVSHKHIPLFNYENTTDFLKNRPYDAVLIGVEINEKARDLRDFCHPRNAVYILGPEDGSLPNEIMDKCQHLIKMDTIQCLNVASAGTVICYDRHSKLSASRL